MQPRMYVLVRKDLRISQIVVQAVHAAAEYLRINPKTPWSNGVLVAMGVDNLAHLKQMEKEITDFGAKSAIFYEDDIREETALAFVWHGKCEVVAKLNPV